MRGLVACPFCRELFPVGERKHCPFCEVDLVRSSRLPPADPALSDDESAPPPPGPDERRLPWWSPAHGRGPLALVALAGLVAFGLPWVRLDAPERAVFTGVEVAQRTGLAWAAAVAWFTLLPLVLSRRSARAMRGVRLIAAVLAAIPALIAGSLLLNPPAAAQVRGVVVPLRFTWGVGLDATLALGLIAAALAALAFGRVPPLPPEGSRQRPPRRRSSPS
ncbi:MAG TPA: hypothetical protein VFS43_28335 [Polyangiaceae bacterium]|nr:hypothetical protein [Polyangiaceae bacterium]